MTPRDRALVIDTSVAIKWIVEEEDSEAAFALQGADLAAPALFRIEAANVLRSLVARQQVEATEARDLFALFQSAPVTIVEHDETLERLALAERIGQRLVTADGRFLRALMGTGHQGRALSLSTFARLGD